MTNQTNPQDDAFLQALNNLSEEDKAQIQEDLEGLVNKIDHYKRQVVMQQEHKRQSTEANRLMDEAVKAQGGAPLTPRQAWEIRKKFSIYRD